MTSTQTPHPRRPHRRGALALALVAALALVSLLPQGAAAQDEPTDAAIAWLDSELAANGDRLPGFVAGTTDWGLMADFALARIAAGMGSDAETVAQAQVLVDNLDTYSTWDDQGPDFAGVRIAGALAKVYLVALGAGLDTSDVDGLDLESEMRSLMVTEGDQAGRFSDRNPYGPDYSLGFSQSWAMMALATTADGVPAEAVQFLLAQQCPAGGFRLVYGDTPGCDDDGDADPDATALAIQVLLVLERDQAMDDSLSSALPWLVARQEPDGSFGGGEFTEAPNANSTGLIAQTLRAAGLVEQADAATAWLVAVQLAADAAGTPAEPDVGALAYDANTLAGALESGIPAGGRDQWRRSTAQGALGLGAGLLVEVVDPLDPTTSTTTTPATTTTSALSGDSGTLSVAGAQAAGTASSGAGSTGTTARGGTSLSITG